jgi:hypothetical protein
MNLKSKVTFVLMGFVMVWPFLASAQDRPACRHMGMACFS